MRKWNFANTGARSNDGIQISPAISSADSRFPQESQFAGLGFFVYVPQDILDLNFGERAEVYQNDYFTQHQTLDAVTKWCDIQYPKVDETQAKRADLQRQLDTIQGKLTWAEIEVFDLTRDKNYLETELAILANRED